MMPFPSAKESFQAYSPYFSNKFMILGSGQIVRFIFDHEDGINHYLLAIFFEGGNSFVSVFVALFLKGYNFF